MEYVNQKRQASPDRSFKRQRTTDPLAEAKRPARAASQEDFRMPDSTVDRSPEEEHFDRSNMPRLGMDPKAFQEAEARADRTAQLANDQKNHEAMKSIPGHAREALTNLMSSVPMLKLIKGWVAVTVETIHADDNVDVTDPYNESSRSALSAIIKVHALQEQWQKDLTIQHLLPGGSYGLVTHSKRDETMDSMGLGFSEDEMRKIKKQREDYLRENPPPKTGAAGKNRAQQRDTPAFRGGGGGGGSRSQGGRQGGGSSNNSNNNSARKKNSNLYCSRCGNTGHTATGGRGCFALKHADGHSLGSNGGERREPEGNRPRDRDRPRSVERVEERRKR
jgi:hypothetical protein